MPNFKISDGDRVELLLDWDSTEDLKFLVGMANTLLECKLSREGNTPEVRPEVPMDVHKKRGPYKKRAPKPVPILAAAGGPEEPNHIWKPEPGAHE